jgi:hypothetical protein
MISIFLPGSLSNCIYKITKYESRTFPKVYRFIAEDYFDEIKELLVQSHIMDRLVRMYSVDETGCNLFLLLLFA